MIDLIKRLEAATEGSRDLDEKISRVMPGRWFTDDDDPRDFDAAVHSRIPHWTTSLDAALALIPGGHEWRIWAAKAEIWQNGTPPTHFLSEAPTPALALCIAALKARNEGEGRA